MGQLTPLAHGCSLSAFSTASTKQSDPDSSRSVSPHEPEYQNLPGECGGWYWRRARHTYLRMVVPDGTAMPPSCSSSRIRRLSASSTASSSTGPYITEADHIQCDRSDQFQLRSGLHQLGPGSGPGRYSAGSDGRTCPRRAP